MELEAVIGLEIHVQLKTKSKMFCSCDNTGENQPPNTTVCQICLGHPGTLPVANKQAIEWSALTALALNCTIAEYSKFDRKHYFYPDLPKAYQISQLDQPIGQAGHLWVYNPEIQEEVKIGINRLHLEEDAAKLTHPGKKDYSLVDYNRGGTPLMEIVTEPDVKTPAMARAFLEELKLIIKYLDVSDADMEKGHLRCDANISLRPIGDNKLYPKTEIKNLNSFRNVEKALEYEIHRQTKLWLEGQPPKEQATYGWNDAKNITEEQRSKEGSADYRYFPEPDLPPIHFKINESTTCDPAEIAIDINCIKSTLPELPADRRKRFMAEYDLTVDEVFQLVNDKWLSEITEKVMSEFHSWIDSQDDTAWAKNKPKLTKLAASWLINKLQPKIQELGEDAKAKLTPENFAELLTLIYSNQLNSTSATTVLDQMLQNGGDPSHWMEDLGLTQISDNSELEKIVDGIIKDNAKIVADYQKGKQNALQALIGQTMSKTKGKANPEIVTEILKNKLS